ncbi:MAG: hypothetical protein UX31_C0018G0014 [Candidatus Nomurabacteria bacterium GW2011_GWA1_46_11]|uniref:Uncharacterized protein n=1 Tax=Candidatus Nomurabacteria bacterium GW2011_GWA1_46_11 TaxID=1618732 RepID=A0A0G1NL88_9BACT|nr:MAG: hypothetical protein UX31_C0018G0014 [Candidatus Nomurabacteria bacterium GW2011_GWA1_46_11]
MPVAGYGVFKKERYKEVPIPPPALPLTKGEEQGGGQKPAPPQTEFVTALRYVDRVTGNIYQTFADKIEERKFSGTVIPKVYEALFGNSGNSVIMRYLKTDNRTIETFVGTLPQEILGGDSTGENELRGTFLTANITDMSISPDGKSIFYLFNSGETTVGTILDIASGKKTQAFDSAFNEWLSSWPGSKTVTLTTKPSYVALGYLYKLDLTAQNLVRVLDSVYGLTALLSPDGKMVLYADNSLALNIYHTDTKISESLGVRSLPEKCVWGKGSDIVYCSAPKIVLGTNYPDAWYKGEISFDDQVWKIDPVLGTASILLDPGTVNEGVDVDGTKLTLDSEEKYLFLINKKDSFLWEMDLK